MDLEQNESQDAKPKRAQARVLAGGIAVGLCLLLALVNFDKVKVDWVVGSAKTPLIVVIGISFLLGAATGALIARVARD